VERTPRELRIVRGGAVSSAEPFPEYELPIPGEVVAAAYGFRLIASVGRDAAADFPSARLRAHKAGDRVRLRYTVGPKRIKEVLERLQVPSGERKSWPVLEWQGEIVWMRGVEVESTAGAASGLKIEVEVLLETGSRHSR
jgi:tRNA(Ile)-lysidine synthase